MKRNNVAKKLGIASLCLATAISAFSGCASFKNDSVALAEGTTTLQNTEIFETSSSNVKVESVSETFMTGSKTTTSNTKTGLRISSSEAYEAKFKMVFAGTTKFQFMLPETHDDGVYGDFRFRIADVTDATNYFDIVYYTNGNKRTGIYAEWQDQIRMNAYNSTASIYNYAATLDAGLRSPSIAKNGSRGGALGILQIANSSGVITVTANSPGNQNQATMSNVVKFDGSFTSTHKLVTTEETSAKTSSQYILPKLSFPNGYTVSLLSDNTKDNLQPEGSTDNGADVWFYTVTTNGTTYNFSTTTSFSNGQIEAYKILNKEENVGKKLLGWERTDAETNEKVFEPMATAIKATDFSVYTPVFMGFNKIPGASLRIDTVDGNSGLRFISGFNPDDYAALQGTSYIQSFGTLLAYKNALTKGIFDTVNYATELEAGTNVLQQPNTKGTFEYEHQDVTYKAYSVALVGLTVYSQNYAARGYIVVAYTDGTTATFYTQYSAGNDVRSIEQTAYNLMTLGAAEYNTYNEAQQGIVKKYAAALLPAEE